MEAGLHHGIKKKNLNAFVTFYITIVTFLRIAWYKLAILILFDFFLRIVI